MATAFSWFSAVCCLLLGAASCTEADEAPPYTFTRFAMDTVVEYTIVASSQAAARQAVAKAHEEIERVERLLWEEDSLSRIYAFNHAGGRVALDAETYAFLERMQAYHRISNGAFDVTLKPVLDLYDFTAEAPTPPSEAALQAQLPKVGMEQIRFVETPYVDKGDSGVVAVAVGGAAKGYAVDRAVAVLRDHGIEQALVNAGGDLYALGTNQGTPWTVGVRHPDDPTAIIDVLSVSDRAVATSGDYQRYFVYEGVRYHHLLDPKSGKPARGLRSATVLASTTEQADALATALFVAGKEDGLALLDSLPGVEGMVVEASGAVAASPHFVSASAGEE